VIMMEVTMEEWRALQMWLCGSSVESATAISMGQIFGV